MAKLTTVDITNESIPAASTTVNNNMALIGAAMENTLSLDGTTPNAMTAALDMGSQRIINLAAPVGANDAARKADVDAGIPGATGATGTAGSVWHTGSGTPSSGLGVDTDFYLDSANGDVYGPKASGAWPASTFDIKGLDGAGAGDMVAANNLSDVAVAATARTNLGVAIGTDVLAEDASITSLAALATAADKMVYTTGVDTYAETALTSFARTLLDDAAASNARTTLGLGDSATKNTGTSSGEVAAGDDSRFNTLTVNTQSGAYTLVLTDAGKCIRHDNGTAHIWTIPLNSSVAFPVGTVITMRNYSSGGIITVTADSTSALYVAGSSGGNVDATIAQNGMATIVQEATDIWVISGSGVAEV